MSDTQMTVGIPPRVPVDKQWLWEMCQWLIAAPLHRDRHVKLSVSNFLNIIDKKVNFIISNRRSRDIRTLQILLPLSLLKFHGKQRKIKKSKQQQKKKGGIVAVTGVNYYSDCRQIIPHLLADFGHQQLVAAAIFPWNLTCLYWM